MNLNLPDIKDCRSEVLQFARLMEYKLRLNDHKGGWKVHIPDGGWKVCSPSFLFDKLREEVQELRKEVFGVSCGCREAFCPHTHWPNPEKIALEAADVANMSLMLVDVHGGLDFK
jgi:hypothetical protein